MTVSVVSCSRFCSGYMFVFPIANCFLKLYFKAVIHELRYRFLIYGVYTRFGMSSLFFNVYLADASARSQALPCLAAFLALECLAGSFTLKDFMYHHFLGKNCFQLMLVKQTPVISALFAISDIPFTIGNPSLWSEITNKLIKIKKMR